MTPDVDTGSGSGSERGLPPPKERRRLRESGELTHGQVGRMLGVTAGTVRAWETGRTEPGARARRAYAEFLDRLARAGGNGPGPNTRPGRTTKRTPKPPPAPVPVPARANTPPGGPSRPAAPRPLPAWLGGTATRLGGTATPLGGTATPATRPEPRPPARPAVDAPAPEPRHPAPAAAEPEPLHAAPPPPAEPAPPTAGDAMAPSAGDAVPPASAPPAAGDTEAPAAGDTLPPASAPPAAGDTLPPASAAPAAGDAAPPAAVAPAAPVRPADPAPAPPAAPRAGRIPAPRPGRPDEAFDSLYAYSAPALVRQVYLLTGRRALAQEAVERAFRQAWAQWPEVATDPDPVGWIRAAAYEYALSPWRRLRRAHRTLGRPDKAPADPNDRILLGALLSLPPAHRRTVLLYDGVGLDLPDTAAETEASTPTTGHRLLRAHAELAVRLPGLAGVPPQQQSAVLREWLGAVRPAVPLEPPPAATVRTLGEVRTRRWARAALMLTAVIAVSTGYTTVTAPDHYEPPIAPGVSVSGVPPLSGPPRLTETGRALQDSLREHPAAGPHRIHPAPE
ncbi:helix-turn-helix domain-containing protein [Streptomyces sp. NPDC001674]|uniref:helix-turn-helix domain-containing protein n=1 Tax=Streptomyces sp. NPDC001674 TaxID=3154394 RepID=UPI00331B1093